MKKFCVFAVILVTFVMTATSYVSARITFVRGDVFTTNYSNDFRLEVSVDGTIDDTLTHPPDYISTIEVTDPTGRVWSVDDPSYHWQPHGNYYWFALRESDFGGPFPSGVYTIKVTDIKGFSITTTDTLAKADTPLPIPVITVPAVDEVFTTTTPLIRWTASNLSRKFRITIDQVDGNYMTPVWDWLDSVWTMNKFFRIPKGILKPGNNYRIRIEGRYDYLETDKRGRSDWIHFSIAAP